jgi:carbon monoxide dehydrogenase subunit G
VEGQRRNPSTSGGGTALTVISNSVEIRCTPAEAFDYLSDHRNELEWNPGIESIGKLTDGPVGLGTKYLAKWKSAPKAVEVETIAYDRPHGWSVHNSGPVEVTVTIRLQPTAAGTRLSSDFEAEPHGFFRLIFPLFLMKIRKEEAANMTHLKAALERRAAADQAS